jgi:OOP family OmpA-OmpF porin
MRKETKTFRVASLAASLAAALMIAGPASADVMDTYWAAPPNESAWVTSYGECWQGVGGESDLAPCVAEAPTPVVLRLLFELDRYRLENIRNPEALQQLDDFIARLQETPQEETVTIVGHTDKLGSFQHNMVLSENRANTIRDYMLDRGYPSSAIQSVTGVAWEGGDDVGPDGSIIDLGPLENNPLRRRVVVTQLLPEVGR